MAISQLDTDRAVTNGVEKALAWQRETKEKALQPYAAAAQNEQERKAMAQVGQMYMQMLANNPGLRDRLIAQVGEAKVKAAEKQMGVNMGGTNG